MKDFKDFLNEEVSKEHRESVLQAASTLLKENAASATETSGRRFFLKALLGGAAATAAAIGVIIVNHEKPETQPDAEFLAMETDPDVDLDLLAEMELVEDLEVLEKWEPEQA